MTVRVVFLWHMHQPPYRDPLDGSVVLPWARLHALKDYVGMVELLEAAPDVHVTFNLVPSLLDQVEAYVRGEAREPLLEATLEPPERLGEGERLALLRSLFRAHPRNLIGRFPRYAELLALRGPETGEAALRAAATRFGAQELRDLQVLSKLAWCDLGWQARDPVLRALCDKGRGFGEDDKQALHERELALLGAVIPAYRRAAERGQVELSTSPYYHPILPLLCDTQSHLEARPGAPLPRRFRHPEDAADQIVRAMARHTSLFGAPPRGMWPPEGALSEEAVAEIARAGLRWAASDEGVLERSLGRPLHRDSRGTAHPLEVLYRPYVRATPHGDLALVFRDRALSDLIGFTYSGVEPRQAAANLLERLVAVGEAWRREGLSGDPVVGLMLDGENAWEHFPDGGRVLLRALYSGIQEHPDLAAVTVSEALEAVPPGDLPRVFAGSWIGADFSIWIGHADDRRAWDLLGEARDTLQHSQGHVPRDAWERAAEALRAACGSDWFWWYGGEHVSENDFEFDRLFRRHLQAVYHHLGLPAPDALARTLITTRGQAVRQSRPTGRLSPTIDGKLSAPDEWLRAGVYRSSTSGAMHGAEPTVRAVYFGPGDERLFVMIETAVPAAQVLERHQAALDFPGPTTVRFRVVRDGAGCRAVREERTPMGWVGLPTRAVAAAGDVIELGVPISELRAAPGSRLDFRVLVTRQGAEIEQHPDAGPLSVALEEVSRD